MRAVLQTPPGPEQDHLYPQPGPRPRSGRSSRDRHAHKIGRYIGRPTDHNGAECLRRQLYRGGDVAADGVAVSGACSTTGCAPRSATPRSAPRPLPLGPVHAHGTRLGTRTFSSRAEAAFQIVVHHDSHAPRRRRHRT